MMDAMFIGSMHGVADSCSLNGGFRLDVANTRLSEFSVPLLPITRVQESISKRGLANEVNGSPFLCPRWKLLKTEEANGLPKLDQGRIVPNQPRFEMLSMFFKLSRAGEQFCRSLARRIRRYGKVISADATLP